MRTLWEVRKQGHCESHGLGSRKLRPLRRAERLAKYLRKRYDMICVLHPWRIR